MTEEYRKKPVEVEVIKFDRSKWSDEINRHKSSATYPMVLLSIIGGFSPVIETLEGDMKVSDGDYIIKGVQGEFYPCKPDIFEQTYELVTDHRPTFAVGEYYASNDGDVYKITDQEKTLISVKLYSKSSDRFLNITIPSHDPQDKPATAEQIATFKRAEHFASKGRKLDEFKGWDTVAFNGVGKTVIGTNDDCVVLCDTAIKKNNPELILIQTAEELQEVENNE